MDDTEVKAIEKTARAFWRRIYPIRNRYPRELPTPLPAEFQAHMTTASVFIRELDASTCKHCGECLPQMGDHPEAPHAFCSDPYDCIHGYQSRQMLQARVAELEGRLKFIGDWGLDAEAGDAPISWDAAKLSAYARGQNEKS